MELTMKIFGIHWSLTGGNSSRVEITSINEPPPTVGKWEMEEAYNEMKKPTIQLMTLTVSQCKQLIQDLKSHMKEQGVDDADSW